MADTVRVLDDGFVRLVDSMGDDLSVVRAARVSHDAAWRAAEDQGSDERLIRYLWRHKHTSPFEHVTFTFEVKAPIFVLRQWQRHRVWSYNEVSARYSELPSDFYVPDPAIIGKQSTDNKQGREAIDDEVLERRRKTELIIYRSVCNDAVTKYRGLIERGWPRELARCILPVATYSHMFATVNLLNLFQFLTLRCDENAQWEIRQYADVLLELIRSIVPVSVAAWENKIYGC